MIAAEWQRQFESEYQANPIDRQDAVALAQVQHVCSP
jgi:hypothetical protein